MKLKCTKDLIFIDGERNFTKDKIYEVETTDYSEDFGDFTLVDDCGFDHQLAEWGEFFELVKDWKSVPFGGDVGVRFPNGHKFNSKLWYN